MSSAALESQGMQVKISATDSPQAYTAITELYDIGGPDGSANEIDVSDLDSTAREFRMGLKDSGTLTFGLNYIPTNTQHNLLRTTWTARTIAYFQMIFTDDDATTSPVTTATIWSFSAYVQSLSISNSVDGKTEGSVTLRITGDITQS